MDLIITDTLALKSLTAFNLIVGRNGSGKSRLMRDLVANARNKDEYRLEHINPERGGHLRVDANVENNIRGRTSWVHDSRNQNQANQFKQTSIARLKNVRDLFRARLESDRALRDSDKTFQSEYIDDIDSLLHNIRLTAHDQDIRFETLQGVPIDPEQLSSGESESIGIASEVLWFLDSISPGKTNILFLDEPDVHLHPDMQARLARFIIRRWQALSADCQKQTLFVITTHSTPLLGAFAQDPNASIGVKRFDHSVIELKPCAEALQKTLPFIAHPLSSVFNLETPLILEGPDDEQIWTQAFRSSQGRLAYFPCIAGTVNKKMNELERFLADILPAIYDEPRALSIRDGDGARGALDPVGCVVRFRLQCYAVENLLVTDDVLAVLGTSWDQFCASARTWIAEHPTHHSKDALQSLVDDPTRRRDIKIKDLVALIVAISNGTAPWQVYIGKAIAGLRQADINEHGLSSYLGVALLKTLGIVEEA